MATKLVVPRPSLTKKVQPKETEKASSFLDAAEVLVEEEADNTEPSGPPVVVAAPVVAPPPVPVPAPVPLPGILVGTPRVDAAPVAIVPPVVPPAPISSVTLGPAKPSSPTPIPLREVAMSLPSQYELDSERKSSPPIAQRRKELTKYVASAVGVAWFICTCAIGEAALRSLIASMH